MLASPRISFVVPVYNMELFVADCLQSIFDQRGDHDYEVIVIDDASTDNSADIVESFADPRICFARHRENHGAAQTITEGLQAARGEYVARIDPDDRYRPHFLNRTVEVLDQNPDVGLVFGRIAMIDANGAVMNPGEAAGMGSRKGDFFLHLLKRNDLPAPTVLARRKAWELGLPIPSNLKFNDWYLSLTIAERWPMFFVDDVLADYRVHSNNMHSTMIRERWAEPIILELIEKFVGSQWRGSDLRKHRKDIYATQYRQLADQYFGCDLFEDARRCYWQAIRHRPFQHMTSDVMRRLVGTYMGPLGYESAKDFVKRLYR